MRMSILNNCAMKKLSKEYWSSRYNEKDMPWDAGTVTLPIKEYVDQLKNKRLKILIPGVGAGHELIYLYENGFKNVYGLDLSEEPLRLFQKNNPQFPKNQLIVSDFFEHKDTYDLILEQTFFCALSPNLRSKYVDKMFELLEENGTLAGVLFDFPLTTQGPPFGGSRDEYEKLFTVKFKSNTLEKCYNSIKPRKDKELFIIMKK